MKVMARIGDEQVCIQIVKRGKTVYIRRCAYTFDSPTEKQYGVRKNLALTSIMEYDRKEMEHEHLTREDVNDAVQKAFAEWVYAPQKRNAIEDVLEKEYGTVRDVKRSYYNMMKRIKQ